MTESENNNRSKRSGSAQTPPNVASLFKSFNNGSYNENEFPMRIDIGLVLKKPQKLSFALGLGINQDWWEKKPSFRFLKKTSTFPSSKKKMMMKLMNNDFVIFSSSFYIKTVNC